MRPRRIRASSRRATGAPTSLPPLTAAPAPMTPARRGRPAGRDALLGAGLGNGAVARATAELGQLLGEHVALLERHRLAAERQLRHPIERPRVRPDGEVRAVLQHGLGPLQAQRQRLRRHVAAGDGAERAGGELERRPRRRRRCPRRSRRARTAPSRARPARAMRRACRRGGCRAASAARRGCAGAARATPAAGSCRAARRSPRRARRARGRPRRSARGRAGRRPSAGTPCPTASVTPARSQASRIRSAASIVSAIGFSDEHVTAALGRRDRLLGVDVVGRDDQDALHVGMRDRGLGGRRRRRSRAARRLAPRRLITREAGDEPQPARSAAAASCAPQRPVPISATPVLMPRADPPSRASRPSSRRRAGGSGTGRCCRRGCRRRRAPTSRVRLSSAIRFVSSTGSAGRAARDDQRRLLDALGHAGEVELARALARASSGDDAPVWCWSVSRVSDGRLSQLALMSYGPLMPATARIRGSNAAARGA